MRILIVDDNPLDCLVSRELIKEYASEIEMTSDPLVAMEKLRHGSFDLVITDFEMFSHTGNDILSVSKQTAPETPVWCVTAIICDANQDFKADAFDAVIQKPLQSDSFTDGIKPFLPRKAC